MPTNLKTKLLMLICTLILGKFLANGQYFVRTKVAIDAKSSNFEQKLDKLMKTVDVLEENMDLIITAFITNNKELEQLRHIVNLHLSGKRKDYQNSKLNILEVKCADDRLPENCYQLDECHNHVYSISIPNYSEHAFPVSCDLRTENSGWTVIQRRQDGSVNFFRNWTEYTEGFGDLNGEFFIGLEKLHALTTQGRAQELYIILEDFAGNRRYAKYKTFRIDSKETDYKLTVGEYSGDAGDSFSEHSNHKFSTWDRDNDDSARHCAEEFSSGWWFHSCLNCNLNGKYLIGYVGLRFKSTVSWGEFHGVYYSLKYSQMMIRPRQH